MINKENIYKKIKNLLLNGKLSFNFNLASHTWLKTGGNADIFFVPEDVNDVTLVEGVHTTFTGPTSPPLAIADYCLPIYYASSSNS